MSTLRWKKFAAICKAWSNSCRLTTFGRNSFVGDCGNKLIVKQNGVICFTGLTISTLLILDSDNYLCANIGACSGMYSAGDAWKKAKLRCENYDFRKLFSSLSKMDGNMTNKAFEKILHDMGISDDEIIHSIFHVVDINNDGILQKSEIQAILALLKTGSLHDRENFLFECLDLNKNGVIDTDEFEEFLISLLVIQHNIKCNTPMQRLRFAFKHGNKDNMTLFKDEAKQIASDIFVFADSNRDGVISKDEWFEWCGTQSLYVHKLHKLLLHTIHVDI